MDDHQQQSKHSEYGPEYVAQLIKGEHMAIFSYEKAIDTLEEESPLRQQFQSYLKQHRECLDRLEDKATQGSTNDGSFWSKTMIRGMFTWDRITSSHVEMDCVKRIRDGEEMGVKELKKIKHKLEDEGKGTTLLDQMISDASSRIQNLNQEVDRQRNRH